MVKNPKIDNDEINLIELLNTLWEGKWKIAVAVVISFITVISYQSTKTKNFTATTEIKPIGFITKTNYDNSIEQPDDKNIEVKRGTMSSSKLINLYLTILEDRKVFENAIRKFNLLEASQYNNEQEYSEAIIRFASSIKILKPSSSSKKKQELVGSYNTISFKYHDVEKWKSALIYVDKFANKQVKRFLVDEVNNKISLLKSKREYQLEDISTKINNKLIDYERLTSDRLAYLKEQSVIAKKLGVAKITVEGQTFGNQNALLSNNQTDSPFYLRGYEAIDKEIDLIEARDNKKAFIKGLFELEKKKRAIEQDKTIKRVKKVLELNLPLDNNKFSAAKMSSITTKFEYKDSKTIYMIAIVTGFIAGIFYVLISNAFQSLRVSKKK